MKSIKSTINTLFNSKWTLMAIIFVAALLRLWSLNTNPPGLTPDEAALGYNAYSIIKTGRDEHGTILPIVFKSFGDFKPGLYVYLDIPFVSLFGLNEVTARLPSVTAGLVTIWLVYLIAKRLFEKNIALCTALVAALNPYLIYFARGAWEANVSLTLTLGGIYLFLKALEKDKYLVYSAILFALTLLTYQGAKLSSLIVVILLFLIYWKEFWKIKLKYILTSIVFGLIISSPILFSLINGQAERITIFSVFSYPRPDSELSQYAGPLFNIFHSDNLNYMRMILSRWFNFYSGNFLFFAGDVANPVHTAPYQGVLLLGDLLLLPLGLFVILKNKINRGSIFILLWMLFAPISAAITRDQTNAVRSLNASIPLIIIISFGLKSVFDLIKKGKLAIFVFSGFTFVFLLGFVYFLDSYFTHFPKQNSEFSRYGYKEAVDYVSSVQDKYDHIVFEQSFNQPYIYFLFYQKYDPSKWQRQAKLVESQYVGDVGFQTKLDNIYFKAIDWSQLKLDNNVLIVGGPNMIPPEVKDDPGKFPIVYEIKYLNGLSNAFNFISIK